MSVSTFNKKFSYRRDSAHWWSLCRRSRSFKVTAVTTNRKPVCDFLLVDNTNLHTRTIFQLSRSSGQIIAFDKGVPLVNATILSNICGYRYKTYIVKLKI